MDRAHDTPAFWLVNCVCARPLATMSSSSNTFLYHPRSLAVLSTGGGPR